MLTPDAQERRETYRMAVDRRSVRLGILASVAFILVVYSASGSGSFRRCGQMNFRHESTDLELGSFSLHPSAVGSLMQTAESSPITSAF